MWNPNRAGLSRFLSLPGLLSLTVTVGTARPSPSTVLTISPASHDFGQVIVRMSGTTFQFRVTLPPGGGPTDAVSVTITGPNEADFRIPLELYSTRQRNTCADSTWRSGSCDVWVEFMPQAVGSRNASLVVSDTRGNRGSAVLTGTGVFGCRPDAAVSCNYADHYSGTFSWSAALVTKSGNSSGPEYKALATTTVKVTLTNGLAYCAGSQSDSTMSTEAGRLDELRETIGTISGPGMFSIEFFEDNGQLAYRVTAWCPTGQGTLTTTNYRTRETTTASFKANPARVGGSGGMEIDPQPASAIGIDLAGSIPGRVHPDADPLNGVSGTLDIAWSLKRN